MGSHTVTVSKGRLDSESWWYEDLKAWRMRSESSAHNLTVLSMPQEARSMPVKWTS